LEQSDLECPVKMGIKRIQSTTFLLGKILWMKTNLLKMFTYALLGHYSKTRDVCGVEVTEKW
jgi:hypothetical protein